MHIPDNYLSPHTCAVLGAAMVPVWGIAAAKVKKELSPKKVPVIGILAAFSFLIMMFNVPLPGGTTGHAVGGTLVAILIGPWAACIAISVALLIQALFFGDGGVLAFGANAFNMAFVLPFSGYFIFMALKGLLQMKGGEHASAFIASYAALALAAFVTAVEFGIQPLLFKDAAGPLYCPYPLSVSLPAMMIPHFLVACFVEAAVTAGVYGYVKRLAPDVLGSEPVRMKPLYALIAALIVLSPLGLLAAGTAWGEWAVDELHMLIGRIPGGMANGFDFRAIMPDYTVPGMPHEVVGYIIAALFGASVLVLAARVVYAFAWNRDR